MYTCIEWERERERVHVFTKTREGENVRESLERQKQSEKPLIVYGKLPIPKGVINNP